MEVRREEEHRGEQRKIQGDTEGYRETQGDRRTHALGGKELH